MGLLQNISGFSNPITGARRMIGSCLMIIGLILCIPSIILSVSANSLSEKSFHAEESSNFSAVTEGTTLVIPVNGHLKAGHNYDIKVSILNIQGPMTEAKTGQFSVSLNVTGDLTHTATANTGAFNESTSLSFGTWEMEENRATDADLTFTFTITAMNNVTGIPTVRIRVYQDPNRFWVNLMNNLGFILIIPGLCVCSCGCCVAPPTKKRQ